MTEYKKIGDELASEIASVKSALEMAYQEFRVLDVDKLEDWLVELEQKLYDHMYDWMDE